MAQFKVGDTVEITLFGNVIVGTIITANELDGEYRVVYKDECEEWVGKDDMKLLDTPKAPKTADEMFAELGYNKELENEVAAKYVKGKMSILIHKGNEYVRKEIGERECGITYLEWKAITKKLEELGSYET